MWTLESLLAAPLPNRPFRISCPNHMPYESFSDRSQAHTEESDAPSLGLHTIVVALRCWWMVTAPIGLLLAAGAAVGVTYLVRPKYTAAAWILIRARPEHLLSANITDDPQKFVQNQLELLRSPHVLDQVANDPEVASIPEIAAATDPAQALRKQLKIRAQGQSDFYILEFTSVDPERAALVVNQVSKLYLEQQRRNHSERADRTLRQLRTQQTAQQEVVKTFRRNVSELSKQLTGDDPFVAKAKTGPAEPRNPAAELRAQLVATEVEHEFLKAEVQAETEMLAQQAIEVPQSAIGNYLQSDPQVATLTARLESNKAKDRAYLQSSANLSQNAIYQRLQKQIAEDQAALAALQTELAKQARADLEKQARSARQDAIADMQRKVARSAFTINFLRDKLKSEIASQQEFKGDLLEVEFLRADYERAAQVHDQMAARITALSMEQNAPDRVELFKAAAVPVNPDEALPYKKMAIAALGAFCLPFFCAVGAEHLLKRVSSRGQLESAGNILVVGEVTALPRLNRAPGPGKGLRELQLFEESVEGLWMYLRLSGPIKSIAVASAVSGEGKTSLAVQLAISIAGTTGARTLLIDGDMRSPDVHRLLGIDCSPGLVDLLSGGVSLHDAIETEFSDQLHVLTAGRACSSPSRLMQGEAFPLLMERLKGNYEYIVVDTPPILAASEALLMARSTDAAVLCVRRDFSRVSQVHEAQRRLKGTKVKYAGAVLSGIPMRSYARRYGEYYGSDDSDSGARP
jgi:polysaccharide biosynthesis transport protein